MSNCNFSVLITTAWATIITIIIIIIYILYRKADNFNFEGEISWRKLSRFVQLLCRCGRKISAKFSRMVLIPRKPRKFSPSKVFRCTDTSRLKNANNYIQLFARLTSCSILTNKNTFPRSKQCQGRGYFHVALIF